MTLHIYGSRHPHQEAVITGTKDDLLELRKALDRVLDTDQPTGMSAFPNDGEGYRILILPLTEPEMRELRVPYHGEEYQKSDQKTPYDFLPKGMYRSLMRG